MTDIRCNFCVLGFGLIFIFAHAGVIVPGYSAERTRQASEQAEQKLKRARAALRGENKKIPLAQKILLDLAENYASDLSPSDRCHMYVYLGYIEDLAGNRQPAIGWYKKALTVKGPNVQWIRQVAQDGMTRPVTWIRHLDEGTQPRRPQAVVQTGWKKSVVERIGKGLVTRDRPPDNISPKMNLSKAEHLENFDILWEAIDRNYSFFEHKQIDWRTRRELYRPKIEAASTTEEFYRILYEFVRELKDFHSWLCNYSEGLTSPRFAPAVSTRLIEAKAVIVKVAEDSEAHKAGLRPGAVITEIHGMSIEKRIEEMQPQIRVYSSGRAFLENAHRSILDGARGSNVTVKFLPPGATVPRTAVLTRGQWRVEEPDEPKFTVSKKKFIWYGAHPSGYGYIRILSFDGRMEIADEFDHALEHLKDTPALIIDIRENTGGFGTAPPRIVGRFIKHKTKVAVSYKKSGPGHKDFTKRDTYFVPSGNWQYTKPIALITNAITGSAADLFACYMIGTGRPITVGTTTGGNLTGVGVYVVLPCNLVVRGYVCDVSGKIIEGNGNLPQIHSEQIIDDVINSTDSVLDCAVQALQEVLKQQSQ